MTDQGEQPKPNWEETFKGKDVVMGGELVTNLLYEDIGVPVYNRNLNERKVQLLVDRQVGEEDVTIRQKEERNDKLLGLLVPTAQKNEFAYLGIAEGGLIFRTGDRNSAEFHKETSSQYVLFDHPRFGDWISSLARENYFSDKTELILREENDPNRFSEIVVSAVQNERERMQSVKTKRSEVRENLIKKLFDKQG